VTMAIQIGFMFVSAVLGFTALRIVSTIAAWIDGRMAVRAVRREYSTLPPVALAGDEFSTFKCAGCDGRFVRGHEGHVRIGEGFEFCSQACLDNPLPFASVLEEAS